MDSGESQNHPHTTRLPLNTFSPNQAPCGTLSVSPNIGGAVPRTPSERTPFPPPQPLNFATFSTPISYTYGSPTTQSNPLFLTPANPPQKRSYQRRDQRPSLATQNSENISPDVPSPLASQPRASHKRKQPDTGHVVFASASSSSLQPQSKRTRSNPPATMEDRRGQVMRLLAELGLTVEDLHPLPSRLSMEENLGLTRDYISRLGLTWNEVEYRMYEIPSRSEKAAWTDQDRVRFHSRSVAVSRFLQGRTKRTVAHLLERWIRHPYGSAQRLSTQMFSPREEIPYTEIMSVRPALTSFAVQIVVAELVARAEKAIHPSACLHVHIPSKKQP